MDISGPVRLIRGYDAVRRDDDRLQLGLDPPHRVVLPDGPQTRELLECLDPVGEGVTAYLLTSLQRRLLDEIAAAGLLTPCEAPGPLRVALDVPERLHAPVAMSLADSSLVADPDAETVLVADPGEVSRRRTDALVQAGRPHLVVTGGPQSWTVGPFVVPGATACLRCVDAHRAAEDPRRMVVVEQLTRRPVDGGDELLRRLALAWAAYDLRTWLRGGQPGSWSTTYTVGLGRPVERAWLRHPECGCAWDALAG